MAVAGVLELQLVADVARLRQDMDRMQGIVAQSAKGMQKALDDVRGTMMGMFGGVSVAGFGAWVKSAIDFQDHLNDLNKTTGISVDKLAGLSLMAEQSGTDLDGLAKAMNKMTVEMGKAPDKFRAIGITAKDPIEAFKQLSDIFIGIEDPQLRAAVAAEALGKNWASAAPALSEGSKSIDQMVQRGSELAGVTEASAKAADEFNDRLAEFQMASKGSAVRLANDLLPLLTELVTSLTDVKEKAAGSSQGFSLLTEAMRSVIVFGGNIAYVFSTIGMEIGVMAAQIAAFATGDFTQAMDIGKEWTEDAKKRRAEFDAWEQRMMVAGTTAKAASEEEAKGTHVATSALKDFVGVNKAGQEAVEGLIKKIQERIAASSAEVTLGRQLSDEEKFRVKTEADFQELAKKYPGLSKTKVQALLAESAALSAQLDIRKAEQAANTLYAKAWAQEEDEMAAAQKARTDERDRVLAGIREEAKGLEDSNAQLVLERQLIGASADQRELATGSLQIELKLKRDIEAINQNLKLGDEERAVAIAGATKNALDAQSQLSDRISVNKDGQLAEDFRGALRSGLEAGFRDGKNPAKVFAENLANAIYSRLSARISDALTEAVFGQKGGGVSAGGLLDGIKGLFGGGGASAGAANALSDGNYAGADWSAMMPASHTGGIAGTDATFWRSANASEFHGAPRFHTGGIAGDEVPIIAQRGEGIFTQAQMRALGGGGGGTTNVTQNIMVGDFVNRASMREEMKSSERRLAAGLRRQSNYGVA